MPSQRTNKHRRKRRTRRRTRRRRTRRRGGMPPGGAAAHRDWASTSTNPSQQGPFPAYNPRDFGPNVSPSPTNGVPPRRPRLTRQRGERNLLANTLHRQPSMSDLYPSTHGKFPVYNPADYRGGTRRRRRRRRRRSNKNRRRRR